jgi:hypothetical protein
MRELRNQYRNNEISSQDFRDKSDAVRERFVEARENAIMAGLDNANNVSTMFSYLNNDNSGNAPAAGAVWGGGTFDDSVFIQSGGELSKLQALNSARIGIESRARGLVGEIGRDRARGFDVSEKQEALGNLTGNLDILNRGLNASIERAMGDGTRRDANFVDVVDRLRRSLETTDTATLGPADLTPATEDEVAPEVVIGEAGVPDATNQATAATLAMREQAEVAEAISNGEPVQSNFAVESELGSTPAEQVAAASQERVDGEMSIAAQIASDSKSEYAESVDIMNDRADNDVVAPTAGDSARAGHAAEGPHDAMAVGVIGEESK